MLIVKLVSCLVIENLQNCKHGEKESLQRNIFVHFNGLHKIRFG